MGQQGHHSDCKRELFDTKAGDSNAIGISNPDDADCIPKDRDHEFPAYHRRESACFVTAFASVASASPGVQTAASSGRIGGVRGELTWINASRRHQCSHVNLDALEACVAGHHSDITVARTPLSPPEHRMTHQWEVTNEAD
jgi:hypothetical protein